MALDDLPRLLASVNRLFYQTTNTANYATLFFADYDDQTRLLRYANCGHLPALLLRAGSAAGADAEWLQSTATVLGLFEDWRCEVAEVQFAPGDTLVLYTDGITEAANASDEEFGELRLREAVRGGLSLPVMQLQQRVLDAVLQFSQGKQEDDITIVIAQSLDGSSAN
jgi:serine phosphatase RsbU (regulator of sigma subunit)